MTEARNSMQERLEDLLIAQATTGLSPEDAQELDLMLEASGADHQAFELAAAAIEVAEWEACGSESMPASLRDRLAAEGHRNVEASRFGRQPPPPPVAESSPQGLSSAPGSSGSPAWLPWLAAAAAALLALLGWLPRLMPPPVEPIVEPPVVATVAPSPAEERSAWLAEAADLVQWDWSATDDPAGVEAAGDVVWSPSEQRGYLRFVGLEANDPSQSSYQLWIFDAERDERYPVDGGVFQVPTGASEVVVPIDARLPVGRAALFAITVEAPGGVVVSSRERIALVAQAPAPA